MKTTTSVKEGFCNIKKHVDTKAMKAFIEMQNAVSQPSKEDKVAFALSAVIGTFGYGAGNAYADDLFSRAENLLGTYYQKFFALVSLLAAVCAIIAIIIAMVNPKEKGAAFAWSWVKRIVGCWFLINILGGLFKLGGTLTEGQNFTVS